MTRQKKLCALALVSAVLLIVGLWGGAEISHWSAVAAPAPPTGQLEPLAESALLTDESVEVEPQPLTRKLALGGGLESRTAKGMRVIQGRVLYRDGLPVSGGKMVASLPGSIKDKTQVVDLGTDGGFELAVPQSLTGASNTQGHLIVSDQLSRVFDGLCVLTPGVVIYCSQSPHDGLWDLSGRITVNPHDDVSEWVVMLWGIAEGGGRPEGIASSGCYGPLSPDSPDVRLRYLRCGAWKYSGSVALAIYSKVGPKRIPLAAIEYDSIDDASKALANGIEVSRPLRVFVPSDVDSSPVEYLRFGLMGSGFLGMVVQAVDGTFEARVPSGRYFIKGQVGAGHWGEAELEIGDEPRVDISWTRTKPGERAIALSATSMGAPVEGVSVKWSRINTSGHLVEGGVADSLTDSRGELAIDGLCTGDYAILAFHPERGLVGNVRVTVGKGPSRSIVELSESSVVDVHVEARGGLGISQLSTSECELSFQVDKQPWRRHWQSAYLLNGWVIADAQVGTSLRVAIRGSNWVGVADIDCVAAGRQRLDVVAVPAFAFDGKVNGLADQVRARIELRYADLGPWDQVELDRAGAFTLHERLDLSLSEPEMVVLVGDHEVWTGKLTSDLLRPVTINVK